jgi:hypothetical protein
LAAVGCDLLDQRRFARLPWSHQKYHWGVAHGFKDVRRNASREYFRISHAQMLAEIRENYFKNSGIKWRKFGKITRQAG